LECVNLDTNKDKHPECEKCGTPKVSTEYSEVCKRLFGKDMCPKCDFVSSTEVPEEDSG